jgi:hypothetical protein
MSRIFAVLAATLLVVTFGLIVLTPYDLPLGKGLAGFDPAMVARLHDGIVHVLGRGAWNWVVAPVLDRPVWLMPLSLGMVCVGVATSSNRPPAARRTRRRS